MNSDKKKRFSEKYGADAKPDKQISDEILKHIKDERGLPCAAVFEIAKTRNISPGEVGKNLDLMNFKLIKCQLGLFGYQPERRIIKPDDNVAEDIKDAILAGVLNERLPCKSVWEIADKFHVSKMTVSGACEAMNIRIKPCQLGAF